jgi:hypothetical protein
MPIEIRELVIRAVAIPEPEEAEGPAQGGHEAQAPARPDVDAIVRECVRRVLSILRQQEDR